MKAFLTFLYSVVLFCGALLLCSEAYAINSTAGFSYTVASAPILPRWQCDSVMKETALRLARQAGVPQPLALKRYKQYEATIARLAKASILQGFRWVESTSSVQQVQKGTAEFERERALYIRQIEKAVQSVIYNKELRNFLSFDKSDRITHFISDISVQEDGWLEVQEEITIYNGDGYQEDEKGERIKVNNDIQRGIQREFPTKYKEPNGFLKIVPFELLSVHCNGKEEAATLIKADNGTILRIGTPTVFLEEGSYTYRIRYRTTEQLYFAPEYDELYWNVTGNGWRLRIDAVECHVHFPSGTRIRSTKGFTGAQGDTSQNYTASVDSNSLVHFATSVALEATQGFTISALIDKGHIRAPEKAALIRDFLEDNSILPIFSLGLLLLVAFNSLLWWKYGKDPKKQTIIPRFEPPAGLSPAEVGYIHRKEGGAHLVTASVVDASVNKYIRIRVEEEGKFFKSPVYHLEPLAESSWKKTPYHSFGDDSALQSVGTIEKGSTNSSLRSFSSTVNRYVEQEHLSDPNDEAKKEGLFALNIGKGGYGILLLVAAGISMIAYFGVFKNYAPMLLLVTGGIFVLGCIQQGIFMRIISTYTKRGRAIADHIEGFKMYLQTTEQKVFDALMPPKKTLELFEKYLPFAIALQVENEWAEQFRDILAKAEVEYAGSYRGISSFYSSHSSSSAFAQSFSGAISSASASSSSGGSSGGGFSGGGGGGGGGGGW